MPAAAVRPPLLTRSFASLLTAQACFGYAFSSFYLLPKFLVTELAAGPMEIGLVVTAHGLAVVLFMPAMGAAVDRLGRRRFLTGGALLMAATSLAFVAVDAVGPLIYALRAAQGIAFSMAFVAGATLAVDEVPPERLGEGIGLFGLTFLAMNAVAPAAVEAIADRSGWSAAFAVAALGATISIALSRRVRERRPPPDPRGVPSLRRVMSQPRQLRIAVITALVGVAFGAVFTFHQPFALELGITHVWTFFVAYTAMAVVVRVGLGRWVDYAGRERVSVLSLALYACVVLATCELRPGWLALVGAGLGAAHGLWYPAFNAVAVEGVGENQRGKVMALFQAAFTVGYSGGAFALGALAERAGYPAVFLAAGLGAFAALLLLLASPESRARRSPGSRSPGPM